MLGGTPNLIFTADKDITDFTVDHNEASYTFSSSSFFVFSA